MSSNITVKKATIIYGAAKYSTIIVQLVVTAILSRLLTPNDYGVVAVVTVFTTLFTTLSNLGLGTAVTQYKELSENEIQDIFTFSEYFSFILSLVFVLLAFPIAWFYSDDVYVPIVILLSLSVLFNALNMIPNALLLREKAFLKVGIRMIVSTIVSGVIAIVLAYLGAKYYAIVIQSIVCALITFIWNFKTTFLRLKFRFNYNSVKKVQSYSGNQFAYNICNYFAQNLDNLITGKLMGNEMLAYYNKAYTLMRYPVGNIAHVITPVLHPILSEYQNNKSYVYNEFVKIVKCMSLIGVFITCFCFWSSEEIVICYFGSQWYGAVTSFKWLSLCVGCQLVCALFGSIYQSIGCTKEMFHSGIVHISISVIAIIMGCLTKDINVLSLFVSFSMIIKFFIEAYFLIKKSFKYSLVDFYKLFLPELLMIVILLIVFGLIGNLSNITIWYRLFIKLVIGIVSYLILLVVFKQLTYLMPILPKKWRRNR